MAVLPVDLLMCWRIGGGVFTKWLLCVGLVAKYVVGYRLTRQSTLRLLGFTAATNAASWVTLVWCPMPIVAWVLTHQVLIEPLLRIHRDHPAGWVSAWLMAALIAGAIDSLILRCLSRTRASWVFVFVNLSVIGVAGWAAAVFILAHPAIE